MRMLDGRISNVVNDSAAEPQVRDLATTRDMRIGAYIGVPINLSDGRNFGAFCCLSHEAEPDLDERDIRFMKVLAGLIADQLEAEEAERERRLLETRAQAELARASRAKTEFISRLSHELRTPLNSILGFGQLLEQGELDEEQRESVEQVIAAGRHQLEMVDELLEISQIESGRLDPTIEAVPVRPVLAELVALVRPLAEERDVSIANAPPTAADVAVMADSQLLKQVMLNLIANAIKYNHRKGDVVLTVGVDGDRVTIAVRDSGPGIAPADLSRLFEPFERLGAESGSVEGTGLGLALANGLVESMGGALNVESRIGSGSCFTVELPLALERRDEA